MQGAYLDHASATPVRKEVLEAMLPYFSENFGNPSNVYDMGSKIKQIVDQQRDRVAGLIGAKNEEIIFTSSGAEANNLAIKGVAFARQKKGNHITGSACASKALKTSPVLVAIGIRADLAQGSTVFSTNSNNTAEEIKYVLEKLSPVVDRLRSLSPIWKKEMPEYEEDVCT